MTAKTHTASTSPLPPNEKKEGSCPLDHGLKTLREQVKNVMIPLLINIFQMKLRAQEMTRPPSRLQSKEPQEKIEELRHQLQLLDDDLKMTMGWLESAQKQIEKVIDEINQSTPIPRSIHSGFISSPRIQRSFSEAMSHQLSEENGKCASDKPCPKKKGEKNSLWSRLFQS